MSILTTRTMERHPLCRCCCWWPWKTGRIQCSRIAIRNCTPLRYESQSVITREKKFLILIYCVRERANFPSEWREERFKFHLIYLIRIDGVKIKPLIEPFSLESYSFVTSSLIFAQRQSISTLKCFDWARKGFESMFLGYIKLYDINSMMYAWKMVLFAYALNI